MTIDTEHPYLEIQGRHSLKGEVKISGAKNAALVIMAGALLCSDECQIGNVPALADIERMSQILSALGVQVRRTGDRLEIDGRDLQQAQAPYDLVSQLRASFFAIGPILARLGEECRSSLGIHGHSVGPWKSRGGDGANYDNWCFF